MKASDIMTSDVITIRGIEPVGNAIALMKQHQVRSLIVDRRHPEDAYGIITKTDIITQVAALGKDPKLVRVYEVMTKPCIVVNPDLQVEYVARLFAQHHIQAAPVIAGTLLGVISMTDILTKGSFAEQPYLQQLDQEIQAAIAYAHEICAQKESNPQNCITAWRLVEDLQAERAYYEGISIPKTAFEEYRDTDPQWLSDQDYDAWCSG
ncbi:MAG: CBS domain-containing protein [Synechococcales cyanobacterium T60_A2020_003]|nr:CBS domain-containing protein [Synechococcales cyanobacterium T60_A2020_003]